MGQAARTTVLVPAYLVLPASPLEEGAVIDQHTPRPKLVADGNSPLCMFNPCSLRTQAEQAQHASLSTAASRLAAAAAATAAAVAVSPDKEGGVIDWMVSTQTRKGGMLAAPGSASLFEGARTRQGVDEMQQ